MKKYMETLNTIRDLETGACIPKAEGNRHYRMYLEWLAEGNTPIPVQPSPDHDLVDDVWVENADKKADRELNGAKAGLKSIKTPALILAMAKALIAGNLLDLEGESLDEFSTLLALDADVQDKKAAKKARGK